MRGPPFRVVLGATESGGRTKFGAGLYRACVGLASFHPSTSERMIASNASNRPFLRLMSPKNRQALADRVTRAAEAALAARDYVSAIDVLGGIGWLDAGAEKRWRLGQAECLERLIQANLSRVSEAMRLLGAWAAAKGLLARETHYVSQNPGRAALRFSVSGDPTIERLYRTHWISPALSERKREKLAEAADRPPELVVIQPLKDDWVCHRCGGTGDLLMMENPGPACLRCTSLADLEFLPSGEALLTRRAKAASPRHAVVVRFSRTRGRYERQGLLVEAQALAKARKSIEG